MSKARMRLPKHVTDEMAALGVSWSVEPGKKHIKIIDQEGRLVTIVSRGRKDTPDYMIRNQIATMSRHARVFG